MLLAKIVKSLRHLDNFSIMASTSASAAATTATISIRETSDTRIIPRSKFEREFLSLLRGLTTQQQNVISTRYLNVVSQYKSRSRCYDFSFHTGRLIVNVSSALVPAFLSIQYGSQDTNVDCTYHIPMIFWVTWVLSLTVTVLNGLLGLYRVEKKYYLLHIILAQLLAEGFQYAELSGRYSGFLAAGPTHDNQFVFFVHAIERIVMRETDIEYFRLYDNNNNLNIQNTPGGGGGGGGGGPPHAGSLAHAGTALYHPTPATPIHPVDDV